MNNEDFSKLLASGDKELLSSLSRRPKKTVASGNQPRKRKPKPKKDTFDEKEEEVGPKWRDRAKERQAGQGEYKQVAAEFERHGDVSVDESKFLGGDMDHTHLVKGLDYALLGKVRAELGKHQKMTKAREVEQEKKKKKKGSEFKTQMGRKVFQTVIDTLHPHHVQFKKRLKHMTKSISMGERIRSAPASFLPGHVMYEFDIDVNIPMDDIPKHVTRSREDCGSVDWSTKPGFIDTKTIDVLTNVLSNIKERRKARREAEELKRRAKTEEKVEDDIFQGVGGFDPTQLIKPKPKESAVVVSTLFDDLMLGKHEEKDVNFEASEKFRGAKPGWEYKRGELGLGYYRDGTTLKKRTYAKASDEADAYSEAFPNTQLFTHTAKIEEGAPEKGKGKKGKGKDQGKGKGRKKRDDSDEEGDKYCTEGAKHYGGREGKKQKLNEDQQWDKIESMISTGSVPTMDSLESRAKKHKR